MKILLDQNLSWKLNAALRESFESVAHVADFGLSEATDEAIHDFARLNDWTIFSKDDDFVALALFRGAPPKIVRLRIGNGSTATAREVILRSRDELILFESDPEATVLELLV